MALRAEKQVPTIYFGKPGTLFALPWPAGGVEKPYEKQVFDFLTGSGFHQVSQLPSGSRLYTFNWDALHIDNFNLLHQYYVGANGAGPFVLLDPSEANLLPANVSSATGLYRNATHFTTNNTATEGSLYSSSEMAHRPHATAAMKWLFTGVAVATPTLGVSGFYRGWYGIPALTGQAYTFSSWMRADGTVDSAITASMTLEFLNSGGAVVGSLTSSGNVALNTTWQRVSVTATAPASTAYIRPRWTADGTTISVGGSIFIDEPMLEYGSIVNDWAPSTGIKPVQILSLTDNVPFSAYMRQDVKLQLREMTR